MSTSGETLGQADRLEAAGEVKCYLRIGHADEDDLVTDLIGTGAALCEAFTGQALIVRPFEEMVEARGAWVRLGRTPVRAIVAVERVADDGMASPIEAGAHAIDIDASGDGWVRATGPGRVRVHYEAGIAADWASAPEALRQGAVRLAAHLYMKRDEGAAPPPAAVTALWRPYRRMRLG